MAETYIGFGRHVYYLDISQIDQVDKLFFISKILSLLTICVVKISVALFLLRICGLRRWLRALLFVIIALLASSTSITIGIHFAQCRPIAGNWDPPISLTSNCLSASVIVDVTYWASGSISTPSFPKIINAECTLIALSVFTDFLCAVIPVQIIGDLQMSRKTKASVLALLCLGLL